ncbi:MAG TPA: hypothetical protein VIF37_01560 [Methylobacter sp.]|jgi:putative two-component system response regulator
MNETEISDLDQRPTVLVVDDTRSNQEVLTSLLSRDYQVKVAGNGVRALDIARNSLSLDSYFARCLYAGNGWL